MYKPERPKHVNERITAFTNQLLPHFFKYAKDKNDSQVVEANGSFVNKLDKLITNPRINCKKLGLGKIDYTLMMEDPTIKVSEDDPLVKKYCEFNREYYFSIDAAISSEDEQQANDRFSKKVLKYRQMSERIKRELSQFGYSDSEVADILVKYLYGMKKSMNKTVLWMCYGSYIVSNLERFFKPQTKVIQCVDCGEWFEVSISNKRTKRCPNCQDERRTQVVAKKNAKYYNNKKN